MWRVWTLYSPLPPNFRFQNDERIHEHSTSLQCRLLPQQAPQHYLQPPPPTVLQNPIPHQGVMNTQQRGQLFPTTNGEISKSRSQST
jgi:hypothetical protein